MNSIKEERIITSSYQGKVIFFYLEDPNDPFYKEHQIGSFGDLDILQNLSDLLPNKSSILEISPYPSNAVIYYDKIIEAQEVCVITNTAITSLKNNCSINAINSVNHIIDRIRLDQEVNALAANHLLALPGDFIFNQKKFDLIRINITTGSINPLLGLQSTINFSKPLISVCLHRSQLEEVNNFASSNGYVIIKTFDHPSTSEVLLQNKSKAYCSRLLFTDQNNNDTCYEDMPTTVEELAIMSWLSKQENILLDNNILHVGTGNGRLLESLSTANHVDTITISGPEKRKVDRMTLSNVKTHIINKHNIIECRRLEHNYEIIIDVNLKSFSCCENHFNEYINFLLSRLSPNGIIITAMSGINFGWNGNITRAYTPGSAEVIGAPNFRVLGSLGIEKLKQEHQLGSQNILIEKVHHHHGLPSEEGPPKISDETIVILKRNTSSF